jgi:4-amino-4-deoxy-L-arabinose transferase-like glycosyltransferase
MKPESLQPNPASAHSRFVATLRILLLALAAVFFCLHFLHLNADFPNNSPWTDWSKYTDEGWYGDAAIRHYFFGHWYFPGDFNPAVALPVWPAIEFLVFRFTGVTPVAARALTLCVFALTLFCFYHLIERFSRTDGLVEAPSLAAPLAVLILCVSPFFYAFERMAILEPPLIAFTALAMSVASNLHPFHFQKLRTQSLKSFVATIFPTIALGLLLPVMILTKTTAIFLMPAVAYMLWARADYRIRPALRLAIIPTIIAAAVWLFYIIFFVRPHYLADYQYLFSANGYTGIELEPYSKVILNTIIDGAWMGHILYPLFFATLALALFWRPQLFRNPLFPALLLWTGGYFAFLAYHNNLQPRYYLVAAAPITVLVALGIDSLRQTTSPHARIVSYTLATLAALGILIPDAITQLDFILHPDYTFQSAANAVKRIVDADPTHSRLILSISGSDITLFTGLPSIDDDFGTLDLDERAKAYRPGWYAAWNELDDDKMDALTPLFHVQRVAAFPAMDDSERNLLILYRLDPTDAPPTNAPPAHTHKPRIPKPLITKMGQQPDAQQLEH